MQNKISALASPLGRHATETDLHTLNWFNVIQRRKIVLLETASKYLYGNNFPDYLRLYLHSISSASPVISQPIKENDTLQCCFISFYCPILRRTKHKDALHCFVELQDLFCRLVNYYFFLFVIIEIFRWYFQQLLLTLYIFLVVIHNVIS